MSLANMVKPISTKNTKISWAWWHVPVIPATWKTEAGESLESGRRRLSLYSSLGDSETLSQKKSYIYTILWFVCNSVMPKKCVYFKILYC